VHIYPEPIARYRAPEASEIHRRLADTHTPSTIQTPLIPTLKTTIERAETMDGLQVPTTTNPFQKGTFTDDDTLRGGPDL